jgi:hypothetical protein
MNTDASNAEQATAAQFCRDGLIEYCVENDAPFPPALRIQTARRSDMGGIYNRQTLYFDVYAGDKFLVAHRSKRTANRHIAGLPVMTEGFEWGKGYLYCVWTGATCATFATRAEAEQFMEAEV